MDRFDMLKEEQDREFLEALIHLQETLREGFLDSLRRSLPFPDLVFDRWDRAKSLSFGEGSSIYDSALVLGSVTVGKECWIGPSVILDGSGNLQIGDHCTVSSGAQIYTHDNIMKTLSSGVEEIEYGAVTIGNNVYIGPNSVIRRGVTIGDSVVIGAFSYVNTDIPSNSIAIGQPARIAGEVKSLGDKITLRYDRG